MDRQQRSGTDDPRRYYDATGEAEWERLDRGVDGALEFEATVDALEEYLPPDGRVLDAGGGAGRYSVWLAERGYDVTLLDLSRGQLTTAEERIAERGVASTVTRCQGSITDLGLETDAFDATCCLGGPLSHVLDDADRRRAASELRRVTGAGGPVVVSVMGLLGALQLYLTTGHNLEALPELADHGDYDADLLSAHGYENEFTAMHFFRRSELVSLLEDAGLEVVTTTGLEGLASLFHATELRDGAEALSPDERAALERTVGKTNDDRTVVDLSIHMLAVGRA